MFTFVYIMKAIGNFKLKLSLDTRYNSKLEQNKGKYPVKLYIKSIITNKNKYINSDIYCSIKVFSSLFPEYAKTEWKSHKTFIESLNKVSNQNQDLKERINNFYLKHIEAINPQMEFIQEVISNVGFVKGTYSLKDWYNNKTKEIKNEQTRNQYLYSYYSFTSFYNDISVEELTHRIKNDLKFRELELFNITAPFLEDYEEYMLEKDSSYPTIFAYVKCLRAVLNCAKESDSCYYNQRAYPFKKGGYTIKESEQSNNKYLKEEDKEKLFNYEPATNSEQLALDMWKFSYYSGGVNLIDITEMQPKQIENSYWWYYRSKTKRKSLQKKQEVPLKDIMKEIIERHKGSKKYVFNFLERTTTRNLNSLINKTLKKIAIKIDIDKDLCYQMARHTVITGLIRKGVSFEQLIEITGHTKVKTLRNYIKSLDIEEKKESIYNLL